MSNILLLTVASSAASVEGDPKNMDGGRTVISITAASYGADGKIVIKGSADGTIFTTQRDPGTPSGLAEYSEDIQFNVDKLPQGWQIRADLEISSGTATDVKVIMGT
jgi:hypothetical protein